MNSDPRALRPNCVTPIGKWFFLYETDDTLGGALSIGYNKDIFRDGFLLQTIIPTGPIPEETLDAIDVMRKHQVGDAVVTEALKDAEEWKP